MKGRPVWTGLIRAGALAASVGLWASAALTGVVSAGEKVSATQPRPFARTNREVAKQIAEFVKAGRRQAPQDVIDLAKGVLDSGKAFRVPVAGPPTARGAQAATQIRRLNSAKTIDAEGAGSPTLTRAVALARRVMRAQADSLGVTLPKDPGASAAASPSRAVERLLARHGVAAPPEEQDKIKALDRLPPNVRHALGRLVEAFVEFESAAERLGDSALSGDATSGGGGGSVSERLIKDPDLMDKLGKVFAAGPDDLENTWVRLFGEPVPQDWAHTLGPARPPDGVVPAGMKFDLREKLVPVLSARLALLDASARLSEATKVTPKGALGKVIGKDASAAIKYEDPVPGIQARHDPPVPFTAPSRDPTNFPVENADPPGAESVGAGPPGAAPATGDGANPSLEMPSVPNSGTLRPPDPVRLRLAQVNACALPTIDIPSVMALELDGRDNNGKDGCIYGVDQNGDGKPDRGDVNLDGKIDEGDADYRLVVDVGGDDSYTNNAGGTGILTKVPLATQPISGAAGALIDLKGSDRYFSGRDQGINGGSGGTGGGAGFLFDAGMDDPATSEDEGTDLYKAGSYGVNGGASAGAGFSTGFLLDAAGDDVYIAGDHGVNGGAYTASAALAPASATGLLIDVAGDDKYNAGFGGANGGASGSSLTQPVVVAGFLLDAGGDDDYTAGKMGTNGGAAGGAGGQGGQGFFSGDLMDLSGNDTYTAAGNFGTNEEYAPSNNGVNGGGWAAGVLAGFSSAAGFLFDAAGADNYLAGDAAVNGGGFGGGALGGYGHGVGLLLDSGGNDRYHAEGDGANGGADCLGGLGGSGNGSGLLIDDSGDDDYAATSRGANGGGFVEDQNGAGTAAGFLADLSGNDSYRALNDAANGGAILGSGFLQDVSGNDTYVAGENGVDGGAGVGKVVVEVAAGEGLLTDMGGTDTYSDTNPSADCASTFINENDCNGSGTDRTVSPKGKAGAQMDTAGPAVPGVDVPGVYAPEVSKSVDINVGFDPTDRITADRASTTGVVAKVTRLGAGVSGLRVEFTTDGDVTFGPVFDAGSGVYKAGVTSSTTAGKEIITARAFAGPDELGRGHAVLSEQAGPPAALALAIDPPKIVADGAATTSAIANPTDAFNNPADGAQIRFSTDGDVVLQDPPECTARTDGSCKIKITASRTPGSQTVTAALSGTAIKTSVVLIEEAVAAHVTLTLDPSTLASDGGSRSLATAEVTDASGAKVAAERVTFATNGDVAISPTTNNNDGSYTADITASESEGIENITATALSSGVSASAELTELDYLRFDRDPKGTAGGVFVTGKDADKHAPGTEASRHVIQRAVAYATSKQSGAHILLVAGPGGGAGTATSGMEASGFKRCPKDPSILGAAASRAVAPVTSKKDYPGCFEQADGRPLTDAERRARGEETRDLKAVRFNEYDGVVVASNRLRSGYLTQAEMDVLIQRRAELIDYVNAGGGLVALASVKEPTASNVSPPFGFLPCLEAVHNINRFEVGFSVTPFGRSIGLTDADVNGHSEAPENYQASHNYFAKDSGFGIVEVDDYRRIISLATRRGLSPQGCGLPPRSKVDSQKDASNGQPPDEDKPPLPGVGIPGTVLGNASPRAGELAKPPASQSEQVAPPEPIAAIARQQATVHGPPQAPAASTQTQIQQQLQAQAEVSHQGEVQHAAQIQSSVAAERHKQRQVTVEAVPKDGKAGQTQILNASTRPARFPLSAASAPIAAIAGLLMALAKPRRVPQKARLMEPRHDPGSGVKYQSQARRRRGRPT